MRDLPDYDQLPIREGLPAGSSWGLWGDDDQLGTINLLTEDAVKRGLAAARSSPSTGRWSNRARRSTDGVH